MWPGRLGEGRRGSSPRTWGTLRHEASEAHRVRFIPTHVGNTESATRKTVSHSVHPHARGEHLHDGPPGGHDHGSSPRTWGTPDTNVAIGARYRFIPTHVGNTKGRRQDVGRWAVHPHARGEHFKGTLIMDEADGSSPRTWGTRVTKPGRLTCCRFIPTHVGNTSASTSQRRSGSVHPHARGEHHAGCDHVSCGDGSSPRTWGTQWRWGGGRGHHRFIPTHVGNTNRVCPPTFTATVHPHARGEHPSRLSRGRDGFGSSPRTWGTPSSDCTGLQGSRFIPTHVGNTPPSRRACTGPSVHPHARGEHVAHPSMLRRHIGSSPRTWGTPVAERCRRGISRFIPTHVGNTEPAMVPPAWPSVPG